MKTLFISFTGLAVGTACQALPPNYGEATATYKAEVKADSLPLVNANYIGDIAGSKATRKGDHIAEEAEQKANQRLAERDGAANGGLRFASPTFYGTVRGDVTIVVQRGAIRGSVTSISR
jgi:hypothetical protein